ncbi:SprB repeat-containing protein, partial [Aurantibacter sp.]|uniref:SprB repeat-containing protein n=1 Tax=Aurantibacter sp. TaxID=2807103 RepID=UPI0032671EF2
NPDFNYAIWSKDGTQLYTDVSSIPGGAYQVEETFTFGWRDTDDDDIEEYFPGEAGDYVFVVVDANNCFAFSNEVTIQDLGVLSIDSITETQPSCSGTNDGAITINISNGVGPFQYSIDNGATYQSTPNFVNLSAGPYNIRVLDSSGCDVTDFHDLSEPFPLSASAGVSRDASCDPTGAEVRITNVVGGTAPYSYSFDGGATFGASTTATLPAGTYTVVVRDASCDFPMTVTVEDAPTPPVVTLTPEVNYNCNGSGVITATPDVTTYDYTYELDGVLNTPPTSNVWDNVAPGTYTVRTNYVSQTPPTPSLLLSEDFGYGETIPNPNTTGYFYENQVDDTSPSGAPIDNGRFINDYEYAVTDSIARPFGSWLNPIDHTTGTRNTDGRYLVINIGAPTPGQVIYQKPINDIIANQPISVSLWLINLIRNGNRVAPDLTIELRLPNTTTVVASANTGIVPENNIWNEYVLSLDPGTNTTLDLVITTNESEINGNDVAIDDISVFQSPEVCPRFVELPVVVEAGRTFEANITAISDVSCNGEDDATITFETENFDASAGFEYSIDGGSFITSTSSPVTTSVPLTAGAHTIVIRKVDDTSCSVTLNPTINEPAVLVTGATITTPLTCTNGGATITASASGGTPTYTYQLEDTSGNPIAGYDYASNGSNTVFTGLAAGDYIVQATDANSCSDPINTQLTIDPTNTVEFTITPTACYSGANDASIQVDVTSGNDDYTFSINGNPWVTPSPVTSTTHTFSGLANGTYTINVQDGSGCIGVQQTITINPQLTITATAPNITACATDTDITISAAGGDGNYVYAVVPNASTPTAGDFATTNPVAVSTAGDYDVHVRDNDGNTGFCTAVYTITIVQDAPIVITPTPSPVTCFGAADGAISIVVDSGGSAPFQYSIDNGVTFQVGSNFTNLTAGTYPVVIRDNNNCDSVPVDVVVTQPDQLVAEATITQNYTCLLLGEITVGSITPTTGGSGDYQYSINGGAWTASTSGGAVFTDLTDDTYSIRVRDANAISCDITLADIIIAPLPTEPTITTSITYNCDGTGEITVLPNDPSYTYNIDGGTFQATNTFSNVAVGNHTIVVNYGSDCTVDTTVIVEDGNAFEASITAFENLDCNADNSGTITIIADNFGAGGYEYSLDATTFVGPFTAAEQITGLSAQAYTITVRDVDNPIVGCTVVLNQILTEPTPVTTTAVITEEYTCNNTGATITASASGGTPTYTYQLEDGVGGVITAYQTGTTFTNLAAGDYIVRAQDINLCSDPIDTPITVVAPVNPTFTATPTACYSGANDAQIVVDVTSIPGNGGFQFSINAGPWMTPTPTTDTTYTFDSLANGTYTIDVRDAFGCTAAQQTITIDPQLTAVVAVTDITTCSDGSIEVTAAGGDGSYEYAFVPTTTSPTGLFNASNTFAVTTGNDGTYDVYVRDNTATSPFCEYVETVTVNPATPLTITATPTDPLCHDGVGSIEVEVTSGDNPYTIQIIDLDNGGASDQTDTNILVSTSTYYNLAPGNYTINVTDSNNCLVTETPVTINNPIELTGDVTPILPAACGSVDPNDYGFQFVSYPNTYPPGTTIEFSADGGSTWTGDDSVPGTSDVLMGYISGTNVFPTMRTMVGGVEVCRTDLPRYTIPYPLDDLDISITTVVVACNELQVTVQGTAGVPNYEYTYTDDPANFVIGAATWTASTPGAHTWTGLIPGRTYVFYVRDSTGCIRQSNVNVNDITTNPLEISSTYEPSCSGANDAEITYTIVDTDGTSHPNMHWEFYDSATGALVQSSGGNIAWNNTITVSSLPPGEYYIVVTEVNSGGTDECVSGSENQLVEELDPISATLNKVSDISCNAPGLIAIENITGGGGTFTYTVTGPAPFTTITDTSDNPVSIPANSPAGNYNVVITDQFGCFTDLGPINLDLTPNPTIDSMVVDNCASPTSLTINATSTAAQILYSIDGGTSYEDNGGVFNNLTPGNYNIAIIDSNGCSDTDSIDIYPVLEANVSLTKLLDCTSNPDAEITIDVTFGSGSYDYEISNGLGSVVSRATLPSNPYIFQTTVPETYTITIYDDNTSSPECNRVFTIDVPPAITPVITVDSFTDVTCNGADDGSISVSVVDNGVGPYTFEIISGPGSSATFPIAASSATASTATFTNLEGLVTPGITYTIRATGANDCFVDITQVILQPEIIDNVNATVVEFACTNGNNSNNATITIDESAITGGSNNYTRYEFINDQGTVTTADDVVVQDGSNSSYTETNIAGGTYIINVYDDNACLGSTTATIAEYVELSNPTATITQDITCNPGNDAEVTLGVTLTPSAGAATLSYTVVGTDNAYGPVTQATNVFTALGIGNYAATITNTNTGCYVVTTFEIEDPNTFEISTTTVDVVCFGDNGSVSFTINDPVNTYTDGFTWQVYNSQGTAALGDDVIIAAATGTSANVGPTTPFAIPAGEYRVEITQDADPSCVNNAFFNIAGPSAAITANTDVTPITCVGNDGVIEIIDVLGGWGNYQYYVGTVAPTVAGDYSATPRFENLAPGTYEAWVIDQNGCQQEVQNGIILVDPTPITGALQVNQPNCTNFTGEIEVVTVSGGQGSNYTYQLIKDSTPVGTAQNTTVFSGLDAGSYQVQITDQWTCTFTTTAVVLYAPIVPLATVVKTIDCSTTPGGEITITQTGGSGSFNYDVTYPDATAGPSNTTGIFTGLTQDGTYTFTITDQAVGHTCSTTITQELQPEVTPVITVDSFTDVTCNGADDGSISVSVVDNGVGPYTFEII